MTTKTHYTSVINIKDGDTVRIAGHDLFVRSAYEGHDESIVLKLEDPVLGDITAIRLSRDAALTTVVEVPRIRFGQGAVVQINDGRPSPYIRDDNGNWYFAGVGSVLQDSGKGDEHFSQLVHDEKATVLYPGCSS